MKPFESECKYKWRSPCEKQAIPCCAVLFMHTYHSTTIFYTDFAPLSPTDRLAFPKWQFSGAAAVAMSATELQEYRERNEQEKPEGNRFGPMSMTLGPTWIAYNCFCWISFSSKLFSEFSDAGCCVFPPALCQIDLGLVEVESSCPRQLWGLVSYFSWFVCRDYAVGFAGSRWEGLLFSSPDTQSINMCWDHRHRKLHCTPHEIQMIRCKYGICLEFFKHLHFFCLI